MSDNETISDELQADAMRARFADLAVVMTNLATEVARVKRFMFEAGVAWQAFSGVAGINLSLEDLDRATKRLNAAQEERKKPKVNLVVPE